MTGGSLGEAGARVPADEARDGLDGRLIGSHAAGLDQHNAYGQLGDGSTTDRWTPVRVVDVP
jgi:hypothetical protein